MERVRTQKNCHTKAILVDSERVLLGSHNWTNRGTLVNRDASLIIDDAEVTRYYEEIFLFDWERVGPLALDEGAPSVELTAGSAAESPPAGMVPVTWEEVFGD
jgi:phosphatidylserine/phosphatidylglycerophosphate/cardiolipin synthase-like enzyme